MKLRMKDLTSCCGRRLRNGPDRVLCGRAVPPRPRDVPGARDGRPRRDLPGEAQALHPRGACAPPLPPVLTGHVSFLPPVLTGHVSSLPPVPTGHGSAARGSSAPTLPARAAAASAPASRSSSACRERAAAAEAGAVPHHDHHHDDDHGDGDDESALPRERSGAQRRRRGKKALFAGTAVGGAAEEEGQEGRLHSRELAPRERPRSAEVRCRPPSSHMPRDASAPRSPPSRPFLVPSGHASSLAPY